MLDPVPSAKISYFQNASQESSICSLASPSGKKFALHGGGQILPQTAWQEAIELGEAGLWQRLAAAPLLLNKQLIQCCLDSGNQWLPAKIGQHSPVLYQWQISCGQAGSPFTLRTMQGTRCLTLSLYASDES